jgi:hypothetical protein
VAVANVGLLTSVVIAQNVYGTSAPSNEVVAAVGAFTSWSRAHIRSETFDMPTTVRRVRIRTNFPTLTANFVVVINGRIIVNAVLGTAQVSSSYDAVHDTTGGAVEVIASAGAIVPGGLPWSLTSVP